MKSIKLILVTAAMACFINGYSQSNIGLYTGFEIANFSFLNSIPNDPIQFGYSSEESETEAFAQSKIGFIYENLFGERIASVWSLEVARGLNKSSTRTALEEASMQLYDVSFEEKISSYKIGVGLDFSVYGEMQYDPLQILINLTFIQQFSIHRFESDLVGVAGKEVSFLYSPYNLSTWEAPNAESSFGTFMAIGPKVNYQLNDDFCVYGTGKYNVNLVSSDGGDLVHQNGFFFNLGVKYMIY